MIADPTNSNNPNTATIYELQEYKRELTRLIWHDTIVNIRSVHDIQQEGIYQGFRMPGTVTKKGGRAVAFRTGDKVTIEYMNQFVEDRYKVKTFTYKSKLTRAEAAAKYPEWYDRRVKRDEPRDFSISDDRARFVRAGRHSVCV